MHFSCCRVWCFRIIYTLHSSCSHIVLQMPKGGWHLLPLKMPVRAHLWLFLAVLFKRHLPYIVRACERLTTGLKDSTTPHGDYPKIVRYGCRQKCKSVSSLCVHNIFSLHLNLFFQATVNNNNVKGQNIQHPRGINRLSRKYIYLSVCCDNIIVFFKHFNCTCLYRHICLNGPPNNSPFFILTQWPSNEIAFKFSKPTLFYAYIGYMTYTHLLPLVPEDWPL